MPIGKAAKSPYETLGVPKDAKQDAIKAAHRKRAKDTHPDRQGDDAEFKEVTDAALVLLDPDRRARFDATGETSQERSLVHELLATNFVAVMSGTINGGNEPKYVDVVKEMLVRLRRSLADSKENLRRANAALVKLKSAEKRITEPESILGAVLASEIAKVDGQIRGMSSQVPSIEEAIAYLDRCKYKTDSEPLKAYGNFSFTTMGMP